MTSPSKLREMQLADIQSVVSTAAGMRLLGRILEHSGYFESTFNNDSLISAFHQGRREEGIWLLQELADTNESIPLNIFKVINDEHRISSSNGRDRTNKSNSDD
jgi:hypothetical protein